MFATRSARLSLAVHPFGGGWERDLALRGWLRATRTATAADPVEYREDLGRNWVQVRVLVGSPSPHKMDPWNRIDERFVPPMDLGIPEARQRVIQLSLRRPGA
jgi:hypothetical protein